MEHNVGPLLSNCLIDVISLYIEYAKTFTVDDESGHSIMISIPGLGT